MQPTSPQVGTTPLIASTDLQLSAAHALARLKLQLAQREPEFFARYVLRDERSGKPFKLAPLHQSWHDLASKHDRLLIWAHVESGKALPLDTLIPTPTGWCEMGRLVVGDIVFSSTGTPCRVTFVTPTMLDHKVFRIVFDDREELLADADHQWIAQSVDDVAKHRSWRVVTTKELAKHPTRLSGAKHKDGSYYRQSTWRIPLTEPVQYPEALLSIHPYVLGAWLGDGTSSNTSLSFSEEKRPIFERCQSLEGGDCAPYQEPSGCWRWAIGGIADKHDANHPNSFAKRLVRLGVMDRGGAPGRKFIPQEYLLSSVPQRQALLAGLLDTDGSVDPKGRVEFCSCTGQLAVDTLELIRSLGFKACMTSSPAMLNGRKTGTRWRINFTPHTPVFRLPCKLSRQRLALKPFGRASCRLIKSVEEVPSVPVRCISVDSSDQSYLAGQAYTVTHNTSQIAVGRTLFELGRDPTIRVAIVSNTHSQAEKIVRAIAKYIETSDEIRKVFPSLRPALPWTSTQLFVDRAVRSKDPSIQAFGVHGNVLGARIDLLILDDILDYENCRTQAGRQDLWDWYHATLVGRLTANARVLCIGTAFHPDDFLHKIAVVPGWHAFRYPALDEQGNSRWPDAWTKERIEKKRLELGPLEFTRQMLCVARDDLSSRFKREWIDVAIKRGEGRSLAYQLGAVPSGCRVYTGVDLAVSKASSADWTVLFTIIVHPDGSREVLSCERGKWSGPEIVTRIFDANKRYHSICIVENNAAQDFIVQFAQAKGAGFVRATTTGGNKASVEFGVETLATEMAAGKWIIPSKDGRVDPQLEPWMQEMLFYDPAAHTGDCLMASWFATQGSRYVEPVAETGRLHLAR